MKKFIKGVRFAPKNYSDEVEVKIQHYKKEDFYLPSLWSYLHSLWS